MSLSANRLGRSSNSVLSLQGLTLEAAIQESNECRCSSCGGREGQVVDLSRWEYTAFVVVNGIEVNQSHWEYDHYSQEHRVQSRRHWVEETRTVSELYFHEDGTLWCHFCEQGNYHPCYCGDRIPYYREYCARCAPGYYCQCGREVAEQGQTCQVCEEDLARDLIRRYSYKPKPIFIGKGPDYLGVEIEVLAEIKTAKELQRIASYRSYLKSDSSIRGEGFEIVTHPMSLAKQLDYWEEILAEVGEQLSPHESCGMHVHLSRKQLSQIQIGKLLVFLNSQENELWLDLLAGRPANHYCQKAEKRLEDALNPQTRYEALNLMNEHTIEFRLFSSSNKLEEICGRIEFCHAVTAYCKDCDLDGLDWDSFMEWLYVSSPPDMYLFLKEWVETTPEPSESPPLEVDDIDNIPW